MRKNHSKIVCIKLLHLPYLCCLFFMNYVPSSLFAKNNQRHLKLLSDSGCSCCCFFRLSLPRFHKITDLCRGHVVTQLVVALRRGFKEFEVP